MTNAQKLREAVRLHADATTPVDRLATYLWMDSPNGRPEDPNIIEGEAVEVVPEDRRLVMGFDPAEPGVDVTVMSVSLVSDPLPPYGQIRVLPSSSPTDSPRPTS